MPERMILAKVSTDNDGAQTGASIPPEAMVHFPLFQIPPIFEKFSDSVENFQNFSFSREISRISSAKISDDLF